MGTQSLPHAFPHGLHAHQCLVGLGSLGELAACTGEVLQAGDASRNPERFHSLVPLLALLPRFLLQVP